MTKNLKKRSISIVLALAIITMALVDLKPIVAKAADYTLTFDSMGGSQVPSQTGYTFIPNDPVREGYIFIGWYVDKKYSAEYSFYEELTQSKTVYAKWLKVGTPKTFDKGITYVEGDTVEFNNEVFIQIPGDLIHKVSGKLVLSDFWYAEGYISFRLYAAPDCVFQYYKEGVRRGGWHDTKFLYCEFPGKGGRGFVVNSGNGTENDPYILEFSSKSGSQAAEESMLKKISASQTASKTTLVWTKVKGAASYELYVAYEGKDYPKEATITSKKAKALVKKLGGKKINLKKNLSIKIVAEDKNGKILEEVEITVIGKKNKAYKAGSNIVVK